MESLRLKRWIDFPGHPLDLHPVILIGGPSAGELVPGRRNAAPAEAIEHEYARAEQRNCTLHEAPVAFGQRVGQEMPVLRDDPFRRRHEGCPPRAVVGGAEARRVVAVDPPGRTEAAGLDQCLAERQEVADAGQCAVRRVGADNFIDAKGRECERSACKHNG